MATTITTSNSNSNNKEWERDQVQERQAMLMLLLTGASPCTSSDPPVLAESPKFICCEWWSVVWSIPLISSYQLSQLCFLADSYPLAGHKTLNCPWFWVSTAQRQQKCQCRISIILMLNTKHEFSLLLRGKLTLSQMKPGHLLYYSVTI